MLDMAKGLLGSDLCTRLLSLSDQDALPLAADYACGHILEGIKDDLAYFGVSYDNWFSEKTLHESQAVLNTLSLLKEHGKAEEKEGALWFSMEGSEDDRDRVLVRATGEPTYFAADAAYHLNKIQRGFSLLVDIWGSDHHGYVPRVKAAISALGYDPNILQVMLVQFVTLVREGQKISMSTRSGEFITLREVLNEVGSDAARFFFLTKRSDSHLDFDLDLAKKQSRDNPVYYVQYAHARICSIFRIASERDIPVNIHGSNLDLLILDEEMKIIKQLADFPDMLSESADALEPHRITFYLVELADAFHSYYHDNRIIQDDQSLMNTRLFLVDAVRQVLACGLGILGVSAPERM
jgi:arginyl-tRNA synthetase